MELREVGNSKYPPAEPGVYLIAMNPGGLSENHDSMQIIPHEATSTNTPRTIGILKNDCPPSRATKAKGVATRAKPTTAEIQRRSLCGLNHLAILLYVFGVSISVRQA